MSSRTTSNSSSRHTTTSSPDDHADTETEGHARGHEDEQYLADTPAPRWTIDRAIDGYRTSNLGRLYRPRYFHVDGIAIHGATSVPPYPASHGCVRVTNAAIDFIWDADLAPLGTEVWVHGTSPR